MHTELSTLRTFPKIAGYEIEAVIGRGGMGRVYLGRDQRLGRVVAIKCLMQFDNSELVKRFEDEARAAGQLQHPQIAQLFEFRSDGEQPYLVMEYLAGGTLAELMIGRPVQPRTAAKIVATLARAIQFAHDKGIIHRDLKPGNILLAQVGDHEAPPLVQPHPGVPHEDHLVDAAPRAGVNGLDTLEVTRLKISDFGLARDLNCESRLTKTGEILGTPEYMSPEQATGLVSRIGPASDIYSLGAILYELLTGRPPFVGADGIQTVMMLLSEEPIAPRAIVPKTSLDIQTICLKCLEKKTTRRYETAEELAKDLERFVRGEPIKARPVSLFTRLTKWTQRRPWQAAAVALTFVSLIGATIGIVMLQAANDEIRNSNIQLKTTNQQLVIAKEQADTAFHLSQAGLNGIIDTVRNQLYDLPQTEILQLEVVRASADLSRELYKIRPNDIDSARQLLNSLSIQNNSEWLAGNRDRSQQVLIETDSLLKELRQKFPDDFQFAIEYVRTQMQKADELGSEALDERLTLENQVSSSLKGLIEHFANEPGVWKLASEQSKRLVTKAVAEQRIDLVMTFAEEHVEHARRYAALSKDNDISTSRMWLIHGLLSLAQYQTAGQKPDLAMTTLEEVKQMLEQMTTEEAQFRSTREMQASWAFFTGEAANVQENWPVAAERYRVADQYYRDLLEDFSEDLSLRSHLAEIQMRLAVLSSRIGEYTAALEFANQAEGLVQEILNKVPNDWLANQLNLQIAQLRALIESTHPNDEVDKNGR